MKRMELFTDNKLNKNTFGIGVYHPKYGVNIGTLIRSAYILGAGYVFTIGKRYKKQGSAIGFADKIPVLGFETFMQFKKSIPQVEKLVCIEIDEQAECLTTYKHPKRAVYLLGAEDHGLPRDVLDFSYKDMVQIPGKACLNVSASGSIVMYDRLLKLGGML